MAAHIGEGGAVVDLGEDAEEALILGRDEALGQGLEQQHRAGQGRQGQDQHQAPVAQAEAQGAVIAPQQSREAALEDPRQPPSGLEFRPRQQAARQHGRQAQGQEARQQDGGGDGHGELPEQPPQDALHEEDGDEDRRQGDRHRQHREADLAAAAQGRLQGPLAALHAADDVLQHHDGVIHHETDAQGQGHQGQGVEAIAQHRHDDKGRDQGQGDHQAGDQGRPPGADEDEDHRHHQPQGQAHGQLDVHHGGADEGALVVEHLQGRGPGQGRRQPRQFGLDGVRQAHGVGTGLLAHPQEDRVLDLAILDGPGVGEVLLDAIHYLAQVPQAHRVAAAIAHHQVAIGRRVQQATLRVQGIGGHVPLQGAPGQVDIARPQRLRHLVDADAPLGQGVRVHPHPHRVLLRRRQVDLAYPLHH